MICPECIYCTAVDAFVYRRSIFSSPESISCNCCVALAHGRTTISSFAFSSGSRISLIFSSILSSSCCWLPCSTIVTVYGSPFSSVFAVLPEAAEEPESELDPVLPHAAMENAIVAARIPANTFFFILFLLFTYRVV